jgi:hypothetical protein
MRKSFSSLLLVGAIPVLIGAWSGNVVAANLVPAYVPLADLQNFNPTVEFNTNVHLSPDERRWLFQNGKQVEYSQIDFKDSHCYLGTYGDMYEPKTYKKGQSVKDMELVTQVGNEIYLANRSRERLFSSGDVEDLFVIGCEARHDGNRGYVPEAKAALNVGDIYRHLAYNVVLKSSQAVPSDSLTKAAMGARAITKTAQVYQPILQKIIFNKSFTFDARKPSGWDRSRYVFQNGKYLSDYLDLKSLNRNAVYCNFRFYDDLSSDVTYSQGDQFIAARMYKVKNGFVIESDQYKSGKSWIRSVRCERNDGAPISLEDVIQAFSKELITIQI